ncbi:hypothetical protein ACFYNN_12970 [Streptomyces sp. NPDC006978]|uniref:hypothetical protein n=1 Tax=Streptomyces sp. NPDC006978 TaxID=3364769 RepID=UPI00368254C1
MDALDIGLQQLLATPTLAHRILTALASSLQSEDPFEALTLDTLNATLDGVAWVLTDGVPVVVAIEASERAAMALPTIHPGETADTYALRVLDIAKGL